MNEINNKIICIQLKQNYFQRNFKTFDCIIFFLIIFKIIKFLFILRIYLFLQILHQIYLNQPEILYFHLKLECEYFYCPRFLHVTTLHVVHESTIDIFSFTLTVLS